MRRSASEIIRNLEMRISRLEKSASTHSFLDLLRSALRSGLLKSSLKESESSNYSKGKYTTNKNLVPYYGTRDWNSISVNLTLEPVPNQNDVGEIEIRNTFVLYEEDTNQNASQIKKQLEAVLKKVLSKKDDKYISTREGFSAYSRANDALEAIARAEDFGYPHGSLLNGEGDLETKSGFNLSVKMERKGGYLFAHIDFSKIVEFKVRKPFVDEEDYGEDDYFARRDFQRDLYNTTRRDIPR